MLNQRDSEAKSASIQPGSVHARMQTLNVSANSHKTALTMDKSHLFKTAKVIQKSFSTESGEEAPFLGSHSRQQQNGHETDTNIQINDPKLSHIRLSDDEDELDAAAAMAYWRNRGRSKESRENPPPKKIYNVASRASAPVPNPAEEQGDNSASFQMKRCVVSKTLPQQHQQEEQEHLSTFNQVFRAPKISNFSAARLKSWEEESPFDVAAAASTSPVNNLNTQYSMSSPTSLILPAKSEADESVLSGGTNTSRASTLSTRAKKFVKEKRKNGPILTGGGGGNGKADDSVAEVNGSMATSILREKASRERLKKKAAATLVSTVPIAVGGMDDLGEDLHIDRIPAGNKGEFDEDITQIKADMPYDEPNKKNKSGNNLNTIRNREANGDEVQLESIVSSNQLRNFAFASVDKAKANAWDNVSQQTESTNNSSRHSDVVRVTQQGKSNYSDSASLSTEYTNQSTMNSMTNRSGSISNASQLTSKGSLLSDRSKRNNEQRKNPQFTSSPKETEATFLNTFGELAEDVGCKVLDAFESSSSCIVNALRDVREDTKMTPKPNDVPFDEDVAIEVEYVDNAE